MKQIDELGEMDAIAITCIDDWVKAVHLLNEKSMKWRSGEEYNIADRDTMSKEGLELHPQSGRVGINYHSREGGAIYKISDFYPSEDDAQDFRKFATGATRDTAKGKLEYSGYIHPLNDYNYAMYMRSKQIIGGEYRRGNNWQQGLGFANLFESFCRHVETVKLLVYGHNVYEYKTINGVELVVDPMEIDPSWEKKELVSELNGCRFNSDGMKLEVLLGRDLTTDYIKEVNIYSDYKLLGTKHQS